VDSIDAAVSTAINYSIHSFIHGASTQALDCKNRQSAGKKIPLPLFKRAGRHLRKSTGKILTQAVSQMRDFERDLPAHAISREIENNSNSSHLSPGFYLVRLDVFYDTLFA